MNKGRPVIFSLFLIVTIIVTLILTFMSEPTRAFEYVDLKQVNEVNSGSNLLFDSHSYLENKDEVYIKDSLGLQTQTLALMLSNTKGEVNSLSLYYETTEFFVTHPMIINTAWNNNSNRNTGILPSSNTESMMYWEVLSICFLIVFIYIYLEQR